MMVQSMEALILKAESSQPLSFYVLDKVHTEAGTRREASFLIEFSFN